MDTTRNRRKMARRLIGPSFESLCSAIDCCRPSRFRMLNLLGSMTTDRQKLEANIFDRGSSASFVMSHSECLTADSIP